MGDLVTDDVIIVTGASGAFGRAAASRLRERVPRGQLILASRTPQKLADFAARGAQVRFADFDDPGSLRAAFAGGTKMLLISTARVGTRVSQHKNAIDAAAAAGVRHVAYTSVLSAARPDNPALVKLDHRATEEYLERSGMSWTFLRDSQYAEAIALAMVPPALMAGRKPDNCGEGRVAFVSRDDCVACASEVLLQPGHENRAYDLTGPELLTIGQALQMAAEIAGKPIVLEPVDDEGMFAYFDSLGVPRHASDIVPAGPIPWSSDDMVTFGRAIREGFFAIQSDHVERITGKKPTPLREILLRHRAAWPA
ncbi:MAG TPA: SDR family oxidoreductase [Steroidobacteraceae bacterium]|nr:SDR family oxidoreductase [Steroidobacteraceae bacterium]